MGLKVFNWRQSPAVNARLSDTCNGSVNGIERTLTANVHVETANRLGQLDKKCWHGCV